MKPGPGRRWLVGAVALFLFLFVLWVLAAFQLTPAAAGAGPLQLRLRSNLAADYAAAPMLRMIRSLRLTVMEDVLRDMGMTDEEVTTEMRAMQELMESPVPTATARSLVGEAPFTATPTKTPVPTDTVVPTETATRRPPPTWTDTPKPTKKPKTATPAAPSPTPGPGPSTDSTAPDICCTVVDIPPGPLATCTIEFLQVDVFDPAFSDGVDESDVYGRYEIGSDTGHQNLSGSGSFASGPGSDWSGTFSGSLTLHDGEVGEAVTVYAKAMDLAGNGYTYGAEFDYTLTIDCP